MIIFIYILKMRKATVNDLFGIELPLQHEQPEKVLDYRKQREYGQKKRIKP
jgi:hypothetical protein